MLLMLHNHSIVSCNYKPQEQKKICDRFKISTEEVLIISHREKDYESFSGDTLHSERITFCPKQRSQTI